MTKLNFTLVKVLFLTIPVFLYGQVSFIPISADYTVFQMNDSLAYVEFYVSFFQSNLQYDYKDDTLQASFENNITIKDNGVDFKNITHNFKNTITDSTKINRYSQFYDIFSIALPFKHFTATISVTDNVSGFSGEYILDINIPGAATVFSLSDIQLSSDIKTTDKSGKFVKNSLEITPYPRKKYDLLQPMLYYYVELNNLSYDDHTQNSYSINYFVTNEHGDTTKTGATKSKTIAGKAQVEIGAFNALSLATGVYYLNIHAEDIKTGVTSNSRKRFSVFKPVKKKDTTKQLSVIDPVFNLMSIDELKIEFDAARYYASKREKDIFDNLEEIKAIRTFLTSFWRNQDKQLEAPYGTGREGFLKLMEITTAKYGSSMFKGYRTDRGRVILLYGEPNEIERHPSTIESDPYMIWKYYSLNGGSNFVFVDRNGFGRYELIHSSYYKELQNPDWYNLIKN